MSAPDTNIEKQAERHRPSIWGITFALVAAAAFAVIAFVVSGFPADDQASGAPETAVIVAD